MIRNAFACLLHYVRCKTVDYALKETKRVECTAIHVDSSRLFATAVLRIDNQRHTAYLFNQAMLLQRLRARCESSTLLPLAKEAFNLALRSLQQFSAARRPLCVEVVCDPTDRWALCSVQRFYDDDIDSNAENASAATAQQRAAKTTTLRREQWRLRWCMPDTSGEQTSLLEATSPAALVVPTYFTYSVMYGEVYWIPTLCSSDKGNRWPPAHRLKTVISYATLRQLFSLAGADDDDGAG